jgi:hypothetical protein
LDLGVDAELLRCGVTEPSPIDDARLTKLQIAAYAILERGEAHTPLERQWAKEVFDLCAALRQARAEIERLGEGEPGGATS